MKDKKSRKKFKSQHPPPSKAWKGLSFCGKEILRDGVFNVYRPDADVLLEIRDGVWTYEQIMEYVDKEEAEIDKAYKESKLPRTPDKEKLDKLCCELIENFESRTI